MAKTAINIDRDLADRAASVLGTATLTATVEQALQAVVDRADRLDALDYLRNHPFTPEERASMARASA